LGGPLECPYYYKVEFRTVDPKLGILSKIPLKTRYVVEDTLEYAKDLLSGRTNEVLWKTAGFLKRRIKNLDVLVVVWDVIKHGVHVTVHGMKQLYFDGKWAVGAQK
jgi:hypothetical protein